MTYILIALMTLSNGQVHQYVLDHDLSLEDCRSAVVHGLEYDEAPVRSLKDAVLSCRPDTDHPPA